MKTMQFFGVFLRQFICDLFGPIGFDHGVMSRFSDLQVREGSDPLFFHDISIYIYTAQISRYIYISQMKFGFFSFDLRNGPCCWTDTSLTCASMWW